MTDFTLHLGDCLETLKTLPDCSVDSVITDPPYGLSQHTPQQVADCLGAWLRGEEYKPNSKGFMGKSWDAWVPSPAVWRECLRVLKPGGHLLAFAGTRSMDLMSMAVRLAGFELRDSIGYAHDGGGAPLLAWAYGSGFPKSLDVSKAIDKRGGASVAWFGPWFRKWREDNGVTQKRVAALFPSKTGGLTGCVANWELGFNMPTPEQFNLIRDTFGLPFASIEEAEREVVGKAKNWGVASESTPNCANGEWEITAPATKAARQWQGWGTALKPAWEPIILARKPLDGTVAENVLKHGTGAINVDGCRVGMSDQDATYICERIRGFNSSKQSFGGNGIYGGGKPMDRTATYDATKGRWPANLIHDGSDEVMAGFPDGAKPKAARSGQRGGSNAMHMSRDAGNNGFQSADGYWPADPGGSAARFFYCAKASKRDRDEGLDGFEKRNNMRVNAPRESEEVKHATKRANTHPTVKPTDLMRYLCRLVTPPNGTVLDPFTGSGSTGKAAILEGFKFIGCEMQPDYYAIAKARIEAACTT